MLPAGGGQVFAAVEGLKLKAVLFRLIAVEKSAELSNWRATTVIPPEFAAQYSMCTIPGNSLRSPGLQDVVNGAMIWLRGSNPALLGVGVGVGAG